MDKYNIFSNVSAAEIFVNLGIAKAEAMFRDCISYGLSPEDAWIEVYSAECILDGNNGAL